MFMRIGKHDVNKNLIVRVYRGSDSVTIYFAAQGLAGPDCIILKGEDMNRFLLWWGAEIDVHMT